MHGSDASIAAYKDKLQLVYGIASAPGPDEFLRALDNRTSDCTLPTGPWSNIPQAKVCLSDGSKCDLADILQQVLKGGEVPIASFWRRTNFVAFHFDLSTESLLQ